MKYLVVFLISSINLYGQTITSVYFQNNSSELNNESIKKLDSLSLLNKSLEIKIFGNCDSSGSDDYNRKLSERRAFAVAEYLEKNSKENIKVISVVGLGEQKQINDNSTDELKSKNRRADIFVEPMFKNHEKIQKKLLPDFISTDVLKMKKGDTLSIQHINFEGGRHVWISKANHSLIIMVKKLRENPSVHIELQGHICCDYDNFDGQDLDFGTYNLSFTRADAIKKYLVKYGISPERIQVKGLGHLNPVVYPEKSEADKIKNRRVEVLIIDK